MTGTIADQDTDWDGVDSADTTIPTGSFRKRRQSNVNIDAIHDNTNSGGMAPAQLYSTESGRLFHSGKIAIVTVGPPARGKTYASHPASGS